MPGEKARSNDSSLIVLMPQVSSAPVYLIVTIIPSTTKKNKGACFYRIRNHALSGLQRE